MEKACENPLDSKMIKPVNPKGNEPWVFIGRTDADAEVPSFGHLMLKANSLEKTNTGKDSGQEKKRVTEDEMVR